VTYRLWDYGRPRPTHVEQAVPIADLGVHPGAAHPVKLAGGCEELVECTHFITQRCCFGAGEQRTPDPQACQLWIVLAGSGSIGGLPYRGGEVWLLPDAGDQPPIRAAEDSRFLRTWTPE
jgi:mannose-6-phosphate isomerase